MSNKKGSVLITLGLLLIAAALIFVAYNLYDEYRAQKTATGAVAQLEAFFTEPGGAVSSGEQGNNKEPGQNAPVPDEGENIDADVQQVIPMETEVPDYVLVPDMEMPVKNIDGRDYIGILEIPVLGLELPVMSQWNYPNLRVSPCRYIGSAYTDDLIIAAHNYQSHFGRLKELSGGEEIIFTDMDGNVFRYEVVLREDLQHTAVEEMKAGDWDLSLFTCTVGGSFRVTIRCERAQES